MWYVQVYWHLVVCLGSGCSVLGLGLGRRHGLFLYAITGGSGKIWLHVLLFLD